MCASSLGVNQLKISHLANLSKDVILSNMSILVQKYGADGALFGDHLVIYRLLP